MLIKVLQFPYLILLVVHGFYGKINGFLPLFVIAFISTVNVFVFYCIQPFRSRFNIHALTYPLYEL